MSTRKKSFHAPSEGKDPVETGRAPGELATRVDTIQAWLAIFRWKPNLSSLLTLITSI